jgi:hypothetical protein
LRIAVGWERGADGRDVHRLGGGRRLDAGRGNRVGGELRMRR